MVFLPLFKSHIRLHEILKHSGPSILRPLLEQWNCCHIYIVYIVAVNMVKVQTQFGTKFMWSYTCYSSGGLKIKDCNIEGPLYIE